VEPIEWGAAIAALVSLWFFVSAAYAALVGCAAIRTGAYAPGLGLDLRGRAASAAGWITLAVAVALAGAGLLVSWVAAFG
jgi:hypothetical protein